MCCLQQEASDFKLSMTTNRMWMCGALDGVGKALLEAIESSQDTHQQTTWPWNAPDSTQALY